MTDTKTISSVQLGVISAILAFTFWGFFPIYFILLRGVAAEEILIDRILFALPIGALIIWVRHQWGEVRAGLSNWKVIRTLAFSAMFIAFNWLIYVIAVQNARIFEASLGYYINPLMYVIVGVLLLGERLRRLQGAAVVLAAIGVLILTFYGGRFPLISIILASSFTMYGVLRKQVAIGAMPGLFLETLILAPLAALALGWMIATQDTAIESANIGMFLMLAFAGPATVLPLLFFAIGARRLNLATLGFLQFIAPTLQFVVGLIDGEPFTPAHQLCFLFIWVAVSIFAFDAWRNRPPSPRKQRAIAEALPLAKDATTGSASQK